MPLWALASLAFFTHATLFVVGRLSAQKMYRRRYEFMMRYMQLARSLVRELRNDNARRQDQS